MSKLINGIYVDRLKEERVKKGLTQANMANYLNRCRTSYVAIENGKQNVNLKTINEIATILDKPAIYFFDLKR